MGSHGRLLQGLTQKRKKKAFKGGYEEWNTCVLYFILIDLNGCKAWIHWLLELEGIWKVLLSRSLQIIFSSRLFFSAQTHLRPGVWASLEYHVINENTYIEQAGTLMVEKWWSIRSTAPIMNEPSLGNTVGMVGTMANWITRWSKCYSLLVYCHLCQVRIHSSIHSTNKYLLNAYYILGTVLSTHKTDKIPALILLLFKERRQQTKKGNT